MSVLLPTLINWLQQYGYLALWPAVFLASAGIPIPSPLLLLAAGAFAELGDFNIFLLAGIAISASVCGDSAGYFIGRAWGSRVLLWLEKPHRKWQRLLSRRAIIQSRKYFKRRGGWAIFLTRFLFAPLGGPINLLAGADLFGYRHFLLYDFWGEILSAVIPLSLGYAFGASWEAIGDIMGAFSVFVIALLVAVFLIIRLVKLLEGLNKQEISSANEPVSVQSRITGPTDAASSGTSGPLSP